MQKQDLIWETLPEYWYESAYMGNGMLGLMIFIRNRNRTISDLKPVTALYTTTEQEQTYLPFHDCLPDTLPYTPKVK